MTGKIVPRHARPPRNMDPTCIGFLPHRFKNNKQEAKPMVSATLDKK